MERRLHFHFPVKLGRAYPLYMVELPIPDVLLENNSSSDAHFWIVIDGAVSTTGDFGYIVEFNHDGNPSHHTLQYLASSSSWIVYNDPNDMEAYMIVDGICGEEGGGGGACENPVLEINQDVDDTCMANFSQEDWLSLISRLIQALQVQESNCVNLLRSERYTFTVGWSAKCRRNHAHNRNYTDHRRRLGRCILG